MPISRLLLLLALFLALSAAEPAPSCPVGTWVWDRASWVTPEARRRLLDFSRAHGINLLLVQLRTEFPQEGGAVLADQPELGALLVDCAAAGVAVHALEGEPNHINHPWPDRLAAQITTLGRFNAAATAAGQPGFAGVHYDIEPYLLPVYADERLRPAVWQRLAELLARLRPVARAAGLRLGVDLPTWLEHVPAVMADGSAGTTLDLLAGQVDWFGLMAYRHHAAGEDGIIAISQREVTAAARVGGTAWVGVEVGECPKDPDRSIITFWDRTPAVLEQELATVRQHFSGQAGFGGLLIHS